MMPERFDMFRVNYIDADGTGLCFAPCHEIKEGDTVETALGRAFVIKREGYVSRNDTFFQLIDGVIPVHRILFRITPGKYEEDE